MASEAPHNGEQRSVAEDRYVRAAYYAHMAAELIEHPSDDFIGARDLLVEHGYDVVAELRAIAAWAKDERDRQFPSPSQNASDQGERS